MAGKPARFSLLQLVAVTTSVAAIIALGRVLLSPPIGSSGLRLACLPALILVVALWFCRSGVSARLATYTVVASLFSLVLLQGWLAQTDWVFDHYHGPPQLIIASAISSVIATLAGIGWWGRKLAAWWTRPAAASVEAVRIRGLNRWLAGSAMAVLTALSAFSAWLSLFEVNQARKEIDYYVQRRLLRGPSSIREWTERISDTSLPRRGEMADIMTNHFVQQGDEAAIPVLTKLTGDYDPRVRRAAATTLRRLTDRGLQPGGGHVEEALPGLVRTLNDDDPSIRREGALALRAAFQHRSRFQSLPTTTVPELIQATKRPETEVRGAAIAVLGMMGPAAAEAVPALCAIADTKGDMCRRGAVHALGQMGAADAVPNLTAILEEPYDPSLRTAAAQALGEIGPAAKEALPAFKNCWEKRWVSIEDAQAMYRIDAAAAAAAGIPRPAPPLSN